MLVQCWSYDSLTFVQCWSKIGLMSVLCFPMLIQCLRNVYAMFSNVCLSMDAFCYNGSRGLAGIKTLPIIFQKIFTVSVDPLANPP